MAMKVRKYNPIQYSPHNFKNQRQEEEMQD